MAKARGARVLGTVSSEEKAVVAAAAGVDHPINYGQTSFDAEVSRITAGDGVDVVYDSVGRTTFEKSMACLRPRGMLVLFGQSSGPVSPMDPQVLNTRGSIFLTRPSLAHHLLTREELLWRAGDVLAAVERGRLNLRIDRTYPLAAAADAHRDLESRRSTGKLLLISVGADRKSDIFATA
jgi:NADPH2:quinone reductase